MGEGFPLKIKVELITKEFILEIQKKVCSFLQVETLVLDSSAEDFETSKQQIIEFLKSEDGGGFTEEKAILIFDSLLKQSQDMGITEE